MEEYQRCIGGSLQVQQNNMTESDAISDKLWKALRDLFSFAGECSQLRHSGAKDKNTRGY